MSYGIQPEKDREDLPRFGSDPEADRLLLRGPLPVVIFVTTPDCVPCSMMKPVVRKFSIDLAGKLRIVEATSECRWLIDQLGITGYPSLLIFKEGAIASRQEGYGGSSEVRKTIEAAIGSTLWPLDDTDAAFYHHVTRAEAAMEEVMKGPSEALEPYFRAIQIGQDTIEDRIRSGLASGELSNDEAQKIRASELSRLHAPLQDKIESLRLAQQRAVTVYEVQMDEAVRQYCCARLVCGVKGSNCS